MGKVKVYKRGKLREIIRFVIKSFKEVKWYKDIALNAKK